MQTHKTKIFRKKSCFTAIKEVGMIAKQEHISTVQDIECNCTIQWYMIFMLSLLILGILIFLIINTRKL